MSWTITANGIYFKDENGKIIESFEGLTDMDLKYLEYLQKRYSLTDWEVYHEMKKMFERLEEMRAKQ